MKNPGPICFFIVLRSKFALLAGILAIAVESNVGLIAQSPDPIHPKSPLEISDYNWEANARASKLTAEEIETLKKQGFVITQKNYHQVFEPYVFGSQAFITSDTVINAYSVLLEDSVLRLERVNARQVKSFLEGAWEQLDGIENRYSGDKALLGAAAERDRMIIGVALELASGQIIDTTIQLAKKIDEEAQRVIAAEGQSKPDWLGKPDHGFIALDYTRFKPKGFYADNETLKRHFRAVSWLQAIPFREKNDEEFTAFLFLYEMVHHSADKREGSFRDTVTRMRYIKYAYTRLLGEADNGDLFGDSDVMLPGPTSDPDFLLNLRKDFTIDEPKGGPKINDQIVLPSKDGKPERSFRIISARNLPDSLLFAKTEEIRHGALPSGLEVAAAMGSTSARELLQSSNSELLETIDSNKIPPEQRNNASLYNSYLDCLSILFKPSDKAAPALFQSPAWNTKTLQTFLGGWAQARHAWTLQAKENFFVSGMSIPVPCGFVEPVPDFFGRMGWLAERSVQVFGMSRVYEEGYDNSVNWYRLSALCAKLEAISQKQLRGVPLSKDDNDFIDSYGQTLGGIMFYETNSYESPRDDAPRICDICTDPSNPGAVKILHAGIGKPAQIYVLYPYGGKQILTHGAVFPYYEFASTERLTDKEWRTLQASPAAPEQPAWLKDLHEK